MRNIQPFPGNNYHNLDQAITHMIEHGCHREVNRRLGLKLALVLLYGLDESNVFYAQRLVDRLHYRIDYAAEVRGFRLGQA